MRLVLAVSIVFALLSTPAVAAGTPGDAPPGRLEIGAGLAGGAPGVSAALEIDGPLVVIVLANRDAPVAETIAAAILPELRAASR
jgi:hypothetical protein